MQVIRILISCLTLIAVVVCGINAAFMLASPRAWFRLPGWLKAQGSLSEERYRHGLGALEIRFVGAVILAALAWGGYEILSY